MEKKKYKVADIRRGAICKLQIFDHNGKPIANTKYELCLDGVRISATTDGQGWIKEFDSIGIQDCSLQIAGYTYLISFKNEHTEDIVYWQSLLNALGFNAGPLDGIKGRQMTQAIRSFQRQTGLNVTGNINEETKKKMKEI